MINIAAQKLISTHIHDRRSTITSIGCAQVIYKSWKAIKVERRRLIYITIAVEVGIIVRNGIVVAGIDAGRIR